MHDVAMGFVDHTIVASLEVNLPVNLLTAVVVKGLSLGIRSRVSKSPLGLCKYASA